MDPILLQVKIGEVHRNIKDHKLVPWMSWDEWDSVRISLFSGSPEFVASALSRIGTWRSKGCLPIVIEVTASIVEIQQKDPSISSLATPVSVNRAGLSSSISDSEEVLAMLYSMAVMRLVNGLVEKTRRRTKVSIAEAAAAINMPRMLIDIRHAREFCFINRYPEASHRNLPSLPLLRQAATEALDWLKSYYWDPQKKAIPFKHGESANIKEEIRARLREVSSALKTKQNSGSSPSHVKRKRGKPSLQSLGRNKFFSVMTTKLQPRQYDCSRKQMSRMFKTLVRLYAFFSSEFVSVLLENLVGMRNLTDRMEFEDTLRLGLSINDMQALFDKWELVIYKLSEMEPELLLNLLTGVLEMIDSLTRLKEDACQEILSQSPYEAENHQIQLLSSLLSLLLEILRQLVQSEKPDIKTDSSSALPNSILLELARRCLLISEPGNDTLFKSAVALARMIGDAQINDKLEKLSVVFLSSHADVTEDDVDLEIQKATRNLNVLKAKLAKGGSVGNPSQPPCSNPVAISCWRIAESWSPCPIGMLPRRLGSSGRLPVLKCGHKQSGSRDSIYKVKNTEKDSENWDMRQCGGKRGASSDCEQLDATCAKRGRDNVDNACHDKAETNDGEEENDNNVNGRLMINGVMQKVSDEKVDKIKADLLNVFRKSCHVNLTLAAIHR